MFKPEGNGSARSRRHGTTAAVKLHDKQSERDHRQLRIDKVGVRGLRFPIQAKHGRHHRHVRRFAEGI